MNYAEFVFATLAALGLGPQDASEPFDKVQVRLGHNDSRKHGPGQDGVVSLDYLAGSDWVVGTGLRPFWTVGWSGDGLRYAGLGLTKPISLRHFIFQPSFAPVLYRSGRGAGSAERLQFRTSVELRWKVAHEMALGVGFYHLSNAGLSMHTAGVDVVYGSLQWRHGLF